MSTTVVVNATTKRPASVCIAVQLRSVAAVGNADGIAAVLLSHSPWPSRFVIGNLECQPPNLAAERRKGAFLFRHCNCRALDWAPWSDIVLECLRSEAHLLRSPEAQDWVRAAIRGASMESGRAGTARQWCQQHASASGMLSYACYITSMLASAVANRAQRSWTTRGPPLGATVEGAPAASSLVSKLASSPCGTRGAYVMHPVGAAQR